jgi:hypothetical protein
LVGTVLSGEDGRVGGTALGGAELFAGGGDDSNPWGGDRLADLRLSDGSPANDFRAYDVRSGLDGSLYLLTGTSDCDHQSCYGVIARVNDNQIIDSIEDFWDAHPGQLAIASDGRAARLGAITSMHDFGPPDPMARIPELPSGLLSGAYTSDGTLVASATDKPSIVALHPDGSVENLLVPANSTEAAPARFESDTASLSVVVLPDGRIAFAANAPDDPDLDGRVFLLAGDSLQPLELSDADPIRRIFPGPDGTLLALEGPRISQIDPATATVERLIDLSEVADELAPASDEWPPVQNISAAAHGDDLVFTAEYQLWRLRGAFG